MSAFGEAIMANITEALSPMKQTESKGLEAAVDTMVTDAQTKRADAIISIQEKIDALEKKQANGAKVRQSTINALEKILERLGG